MFQVTWNTSKLKYIKNTYNLNNKYGIITDEIIVKYLLIVEIINNFTTLLRIAQKMSVH